MTLTSQNVFLGPQTGRNVDVCLGVTWCTLGHELGANSEGSYTNHDLDDFVLDGSLTSDLALSEVTEVTTLSVEVTSLSAVDSDVST